MSRSSSRHSPVALIAGCGDVGSRLAKHLLHDGMTVYALRRRVALLPSGVHALAGDLTDRKALGVLLPATVDYLFYTAAASRHDEAGYRLAYYTGLDNVLSVLQEQRVLVRRVFFTSSTGVYHQRDNERVDEESATMPESVTGRILLESEQLPGRYGFPSVVVRFSGIYGPGRTYLIDRVRAGEGYAKTPVVYGNRIHADDCAGLLAFLLNKDRDGFPLQPLYLGTDSCSAPLGEVSTWLAERLGVQLHTPLPVRRGGGKRCSNHRITGAGYRFLYPDYRSGYASFLPESPPAESGKE